jgi:multiple sugar transport system substrate-binding protein
MQLPRMIDSRLLFYRTDILANAHLHVPATWEELSRQAHMLTAPPDHYGYAFPGRFSGLFGTFFELVVMAGGRLFDEHGKPVFEQDAVKWALSFLRDLYTNGAVSPALPDWHFDEVLECFRRGQAAFVADYPAFFGLYNDPATSQVIGRYDVVRYPVGPAGKRAVYSGMHSFAIPITARNVEASLALLRFLLDEESQWLEAQHGAFPARVSVQQRLQNAQVPGSLAARRLNLLKETIQEDMIMFPPLARYPQIEDTLWPVVQQAFIGALPVSEAAECLKAMAETILSDTLL